mmetsp:Transcript_14064/g.40489  ORF Transcript_14064/g.40489 Transcript_14064/m.40489 type:complete len:217 (-) Transcript_14064:30-680(-)
MPLDAGLARLRDEHAAGIKPRLAELVELLRVQLVARAPLQGVVQIHDDDVIGPGGLLQDLLRIVDDQLQARVREGLLILNQVLLAEVHDVPVDVHHDALLHRLVAEHLAGGRTLAAAADVDGLRVRVQEHGGVHQGLVVDEFVDLCRLQQAVDHEALAEGLELHDVDRLPLRGRRSQNLADLVHAAEAILELLLDPLGHGYETRGGRGRHDALAAQ